MSYFSLRLLVGKLLRGSKEDLEGADANSTPMMANAPIISCGVECIFSTLRDLNTKKDQSL